MIVYTAIVAYTIIQYRLLDLTGVLERGLSYLLIAVFLAIPSYIVILHAEPVYFGSISYGFSVTLLTLFILLIIAIYRIQPQAQAAVARTLFRRRYDQSETLSAFSRALLTILDVEALTNETVRTLTRVLGITSPRLYALEKDKAIYALSASDGMMDEVSRGVRFPCDDALPQHLAIYQAVLVRE